MPRWKAWLCRLHERRHEDRVALVAGLRRGAGLDRGDRAPSSVSRASARQPSGVSAAAA